MDFSRGASFRRVLPLFAAALLMGCDQQQPVQPSTEAATEAQLSHQPEGDATASGVYRAVGSTAAAAHGFRVGQQIGMISVTDDGSTLTVTGTASGLMDNDLRYASLFYDKASPPQGSRACEPGRNVGTGTDHPLSLTLAQMEIGTGGSLDFWEVDGDGNGTLGPTSTLAYVPVDMIGTVSIRDVTVNRGFGPEAVVACAKITSHTNKIEAGAPNG